MLKYHNRPEDFGISSKRVLDFIEVTERDEAISLKTFMLLHDDHILTQFNKVPYALEDQHLLFSMTKSITSLGIGIAVDKGFIKLDDQVIAYFPNKLPESMGKHLRCISIKDLLTMSSGIHDDTYAKIFPQKDWVKEFLAQKFPHMPGTYYCYSTHGSHMLSAIVETATGQSLRDFLSEHLFLPLNIPKPQWETSPSGLTAGGMGLSLTTDAIAKIGIMLLNKGVYQGRRILSDDYIKAAISPQIYKHTEKDKENKKYSGLHYGYQIHIGKNNDYRLDGAFGQICLVVPDKKLIVVATSRKTKTEVLLKYIYEYIINVPSQMGKTNKDYCNILNARLKTLSYNICKPSPVYLSDEMPQLDKRCYFLKENPNNMKKVIFNKEKWQYRMKIINQYHQDYTVEFNYAHQYKGTGFFIKDIQCHKQTYISYARWVSQHKLIVQVIYLETPYEVTYEFLFNGNKIEMTFHINTSFTLKNCEVEGYLDRP